MGSSPESRLLAALVRIEELTRDRQPVGRGHGDADDVEGTIACDDAVGFNPIPLLRAFDAHDVRAVIIGQVAGILHGSTELTGDLDLLWSGKSAEAEAMAASFRSVGADLQDDDGNAVEVVANSLLLPKVEFRSGQSAGDCCTPALSWGELAIGDFLDRAETAVVDGARLHYISRADLIAMRLAVGRPKDLRRAAELEGLRH